MAAVQPPPRKGQDAKVLKNLHVEQLAKLSQKHQQECDLLEDLRTFTKQKCAIEKSYAEALSRLANNYLGKKLPPVNEIQGEAAKSQWSIWAVWACLLEETDRLSRARLAAAEIWQQRVIEENKTVKLHKGSLAKKPLEALRLAQADLQATVLQLDKCKKLYVEEEIVTHDVREKHKDVEEKLKKKKGNFFQSLSSLQKSSAKLGSRRNLCEERSTTARNDYLLQLAASNSHQERYFLVDLPEAMKALDGELHERLADFFNLLGRTELLTCQAALTSYTRLKDQSQTVTRDYDNACYSGCFPVLQNHITYAFTPCPGDEVTTVSNDRGAGQSLQQKAKQFSTRLAQAVKELKELYKKLNTLQALKDAGNKVDPGDPNGPDLECKIDETKHKIRSAETAKVKAEARLECMRQGGVNVEEFMVDLDSLAAFDLVRSASQASIRSEMASDDSDVNEGTSGDSAAASQTSQQEPDEEDEDIASHIGEMDASWQINAADVEWPVEPEGGPEEAEVTAETAPEPVQAVQQIAIQPLNYDWSQPIRCLALYTYVAQNADELSMMENEEIELVGGGEGEGDGWVKARNYKGEEGFVPQNYLDIPDLHEEAALQMQIQNEMDAEAETMLEEQRGPNDVIVDSQANPQPVDIGGYSVESEISFSSVDYTYQPAYNNNEPELPLDDLRQAPDSLPLHGYCCAVYDYDAACAGELSFREDDVILILNRDGQHGVDDGWWEGKLISTGEVGVFPSLVVEECGPNGEPLTPKDSPIAAELSAPPVFTPPEVPMFLLPPEKVIITQPTPSEQESSELECSAEVVSYTYDPPHFEIELSGDQQSLYKTQFSEAGNPEVVITTAEDEIPTESEESPCSATSIVVTAATPTVEHAEENIGEESIGEPEKVEEKVTEVATSPTKEVGDEIQKVVSSFSTVSGPDIGRGDDAREVDAIEQELKMLEMSKESYA